MRVSRLALCFCLGLTAAAAQSIQLPPVPSGPYEPVTGGVQFLNSPAERAAGLNLLNVAGQNYTFFQQGRPDTALIIDIHSQGNSSVEGDGQMTDILVGTRRTWSANFAGTVSGIRYDPAHFPVPMRVWMARNAVLWPVDLFPALSQIRVARADFQGQAVTCVLVNEAVNPAPQAGRSWRESEYCMDNNGLLRLASRLPGVAIVYDYSHPLQFAGHSVASDINGYEAGRQVLSVHVERLGSPTDDDLATLAQARTGPSYTFVAGTRGYFPAQPGTAVEYVAVVHATVGPSGNVIDAEVIAGADPALDEAALSYVRARHYPPIAGQREFYAHVELPHGFTSNGGIPETH